MKANKWILPGLLAVLLALPGAVSAHDGKDCANAGEQGEHHHMALSDDKRQLLYETMKKVFEQDKAQIEQMHKLHKDMHEVLAADTFDEHKFMTLGAQITKVREKLHHDRMQAFASIAGKFTPEERVMIAKMHRHHHHHHGHGDAWGGHPSNGSAPQNNDQAYPPYQAR